MDTNDYENLRFYNYIPVNKELKKSCIPCPDTEDYEAKLNKEFDEELTKVFQGNILDQINAKDINADLKRDLKKKLDILSKKTDKAIVQLIKQKINENKNKENITNTNDDEKEKETMTLNFDKKSDKNFGHVLYKTLDKLDVMDDESD
ncbi:pre-mRNA-splicing factor CWF18, putative [Plasmodium reichenowi]|uniref:Pre-mRNA-splicing factor CWF18, putative n=1 Tax=Plasmodium reichenowi TaxID=5854 RepID=A0A060S0A2_PLARE|nr:pre-mRNA-splicing factor CWF18, putative [Plasmodium reichenowi]KYN94165.1 pre-mRNA-splicing factor CWF18, putative [Plasmodium reichenowi]CDO66979.1 pre-mRNA-splicing factor CWF18, putative [Plasmodium reichenowi]SOV83133.1 pre-mRNA-splicing factor CWF18, putative [Plasmodium reichenowi]